MNKYEIAENIKAIRLLKKYTQEYIAEQMGMSQANYSKIENGQMEFSVNNLNRIATALHVEVDMLIQFNPSDLLRKG